MPPEEPPTLTSASFTPIKPQDSHEPPTSDLLSAAMSSLNTTTSSHTPPTSSQHPSATPLLPPLPPNLASIHHKTTPEILSDLNSHPLFMTELESNSSIEALQALAYEGPPSEVATNFKDRGNESFKEKNWKDAKEFYTKGIQVLLGEVRRRQGLVPPLSVEKEVGGEEGGGGGWKEGDKEEIKNEISILESLLSNRSATNLHLQNYRASTQDSSAVLRINPQNTKAYYRSAKALLALGRITEADDACSRGLEIDGGNIALLALASDIIKRNKEVEERRRREREREERQVLEAKTLNAALKARGIKIRKSTKPPEMEDATIKLVPDAVDPTSSLIFPTVLLYPLVLESDFIKAFGEMETLEGHLGYILPTEWDGKGEYTAQGVECYMESAKGGLIKVGKKVALLKVLSGGSVEVVDGVVRVYVLPKVKAGDWIGEWKRRKGVEGGGAGT